jgi:hypothetical protein
MVRAFRQTRWTSKPALGCTAAAAFLPPTWADCVNPQHERYGSARVGFLSRVRRPQDPDRLMSTTGHELELSTVP